jgi:hypothetical protein
MAHFKLVLPFLCISSFLLFSTHLEFFFDRFWLPLMVSREISCFSGKLFAVISVDGYPFIVYTLVCTQE